MPGRRMAGYRHRQSLDCVLKTNQQLFFHVENSIDKHKITANKKFTENCVVRYLVTVVYPC